MKNITKGMLIGSGLAVGAVAMSAAATHTMAHSLVRIALDRRMRFEPSIRTKKLFSGCRELERIERLCSENADLLKESDCKQIRILGRDGERLVGHLRLSDAPKRTIIAMHGWRTTWARDFGAVSEFWYKNGCNVLYAEQRGHSKSGGSFIGFGIAERFDCLSWIERLNSEGRFAELPIYLCGVSMGASTVLMTTGFDLPKNVKGVIADCGFTSPHGIFKHVVNKNLHCPYNSFTVRDIDRVCKKRMDMSLSSYSTLEALESCRVPVLFVHGSADRFVPIEMTYDNFRACASEKRMFIVPGADHGMCYFTDRRGYEREMLRFFADCEGRTKP